MSQQPALLPDPTRGHSAAARFFIRCGQKARTRWRDENTVQLFSLAQYMDCEGLLAGDARHLVDGGAP